jgi:hypothetical protein
MADFIFLKVALKQLSNDLRRIFINRVIFFSINRIGPTIAYNPYSNQYPLGKPDVSIACYFHIPQEKVIWEPYMEPSEESVLINYAERLSSCIEGKVSLQLPKALEKISLRSSMKEKYLWTNR